MSYHNVISTPAFAANQPVNHPTQFGVFAIIDFSRKVLFAAGVALC